jgi:hypothetical protein
MILFCTLLFILLMMFFLLGITYDVVTCCIHATPFIALVFIGSFDWRRAQHKGQGLGKRMRVSAVMSSSRSARC